MSAFRKVSSTVILVTYCRAGIQGHARHFCTTPRFGQNETNAEVKATGDEEEEFRVYEIEGLKRPGTEKASQRAPVLTKPPRYHRMPTDQDWTDVWPTASTFKWSAIPFPVRQGLVKNSGENKGIVPSKYANLELMKGPNFLHLTPAHIKKHCAVLKQFCTEWPEGLETDKRCQHHFPLETVTCDYVFAGPVVRDPRARVATIKFQLSDLDLDYHAKDKFIRLVGDRYTKETDTVVFESDRCPLKTQNMEYLKFLLTAVYFESWKREKWEEQKNLIDMEKYIWDLNASKKSCLSILKTIKDTDDTTNSKEGRLDYLSVDISDDEALCSLPQVTRYKSAVEKIFNQGENDETLDNYKKAVKELLNIQSDVS